MKFSLNKQDKAQTEKALPTEAQRAAGRRTLKNGAYATALAALVLVAVLLVNLVAAAIPTKYTQFDISTSKLFTLSDTTKTMLASLDKDVTAYYLAETGSEDANITRMLDRYAGESSHFSWQQRDPAIYPTFASKYDAADATSGSVILVSGENHTLVDYYDMYQADYSDYYTTGSYTMSFDAESQLTSGIAKVLSENAYVLYQLTGHGEAALETTFTDTLANANVSVSELNLLTAGEIPADCAALILGTPQVDYTAENIAALKAYLDGGGKMLVTTSMEYDTPNLDALLAEYGMSRQSGLLIETDADHYAYRYPQTYLLPTLASNDITSGMTSGMYVFTPVAQGIV
ncbi:MAG: Gldg family protein, partial [Gemmiger sp.]|nr:Gldg family protein [Gemmiger sp.]